ncbi:periplasmic protein TorT [Litoreibacter arenae DSM 19593]|uniref:Periplasmic protein TorT n=1 Tax=Litoreibacter arenae DSM 19593 TaxID=1123360 RepID=S9QKK5_9RHOB|nr:periplasmic protein TorT [Litoreibacter arenae DSM 19593]
MNGSVEAASFDDPVTQGVMAIRQAVSANELAPEAVGPEITLLTRNDENFDHVRISPASYFPAVQ